MLSLLSPKHTYKLHNCQHHTPYLMRTYLINVYSSKAPTNKSKHYRSVAAIRIIATFSVYK